MSENTTYANPGALVSTEWLAEHLDDPRLRVVEVDEDTDAYAESHIPGALAWDSSRDLHHPVRRDCLDGPAVAALRSGPDQREAGA